MRGEKDSVYDAVKPWRFAVTMAYCSLWLVNVVAFYSAGQHLKAESFKGRYSGADVRARCVRARVR